MLDARPSHPGAKHLRRPEAEVVLVDQVVLDRCGVPESLADELAWCLERFVTAMADEGTMRRATEALTAWHARR